MDSVLPLTRRSRLHRKYTSLDRQLHKELALDIKNLRISFDILLKQFHSVLAL